MSEALTIAGMKPKEFGRNLMIAAEEQERQELIKSAVNQVREIKRQLEHCENSIRDFSALKATLEIRLGLIEKGSFKMTSRGEIVYLERA